MKETKPIMGMPITIEIVDDFATQEILDKGFDYFSYVDNVFSTYKETSEISAINRGEIKEKDYSQDMKEIFLLSEKTKKLTNGYFDIKTLEGRYDPSGMVKGWAIHNVSKLLTNLGCKNFYVDAGGDIEAHGKNSKGEVWRFGIKNPFNEKEIIKVVQLQDKGIATSGTYIRGQHIYNPITRKQEINDIVSLTVIGPNIYEADRFATPAFAMGKKGIEFLAKQNGLEGYMISSDGIATMTEGFNKYII